MISKALAVVLTFAAGTTILGQASNPAVPSPAKPAATAPADPADAIRKLSRRERKQRLEKLEVRHQDFAADVEPIILPAELDMFLMLESDAQRDAFVDEFWRRRDHLNHTSGAFKDMYYRRLEVAKQQFKKASSDRARMFLLYGPPVEVVHSACARLLQPTEIWKYDQIPGLGANVRLLFYKPRHQNEYRLWNPVGGAVAISDLLVADDAIAERSAQEASAARQAIQSSSPYAYINKIQLECSDGNEIMLAVTRMIQNRVDLLKLFEPPELKGEDVQKMMRSVVIANPNAPKLTAELSVAYPAKDGSRTDAQMMVLVPRAQLSPAEAGGVEMYTIDVTGEVLKDGQLWEKYRYRFDFPGETAAEKLPVVVDRLLRPAEYVSRIKVTDANTGAEAVIEQTIQVPEIFTPEPVEAVTEAGAISAGMTAAATIAERPNATAAVSSASSEAPESTEPRIRILPPPDDMISGMRTIETLISGDGIKGVEFSMDGRKLAVRRTPPYSMDFDFGEVPMMRRIRAVALDAKGKPLTGDELVVNTGTDPFRVRIVSPRVAPRLAGLSRVEMDVRVPDGEELAALELYWNETRLATLYDAPFVQTIDIPPTEGPGYLRAVATLKDGAVPPVEDVVMVNTPSYMEELNVHLIELPTTVLVNGKPTDKLTEKAFKILDEGQPVTISKFEYVRNLPLSIGMAIDSSGSMQQRMDEAQKAGAQFFQNVMKKGDKAFLVSFDDEPRLVQKWSTRTSDVHAGLAKVRAEDKTALYDAVVYALYNFHGVQGQKALVLISDGKDTASKFTFDQALEYARRSGVPIFGIGIGIRPTETDVRFKFDRLCRDTGGASFYIEQARELQRVYDDIQTELRSQYILGFYPSSDIKAGGKWRDLTVQVSEGKAKTIKGYFP
jgi:VWFA-related protein